MTSNRGSIRHGQRIEPVPVETLLSDDPELHLVEADMAAWHEAHPCRCKSEDCRCGEQQVEYDIPGAGQAGCG